MSEQSEERKRLNPSILQTALLDEIAERLLSLEKLAKKEVPEGIVEPIEDVAVTSTPRHVTPLKDWFSVAVINDGPDNLHVIVNTEKSFDEHRVAVNETYTIDMRRGLIRDVLLRCDQGEHASIRMVGVR